MFQHPRASGVPEGQSGPLQAKHESLDIKPPRAHVGCSVAFSGDAMTQDHADFIAKLRQIEEQANSAHADLVPGLLRHRVQHIAMLAKTLRGRLEFGIATVVRVEPGAASPGAPDKPPA
jgi:hypothetical protein